MAKLIAALGLVLLSATLSFAQSGFFILSGQFGHVEDLGTILSGEQIEVTVVMARANEQAEPCPLKSTIWLAESNDADGTQIRVERSDTEIATVVLEEAEFTGEGVLVLQTQADTDDCIGYISISIAPPSDASGASSN